MYYNKGYMKYLGDQPVNTLWLQGSEHSWKGREGTGWEWHGCEEGGNQRILSFFPPFLPSLIRDPDYILMRDYEQRRLWMTLLQKPSDNSLFY